MLPQATLYVLVHSKRRTTRRTQTVELSLQQIEDNTVMVGEGGGLDERQRNGGGSQASEIERQRERERQTERDR